MCVNHFRAHKQATVWALTSHSPMASWFFSCMSQSSWTLSAQWWMVRITGLVSRAPGGPQLTTGLSTVWMSSTGGLEKTDNHEEQQEGCLVGYQPVCSSRVAVLISPVGCVLCCFFSHNVHIWKNSAGVIEAAGVQLEQLRGDEKIKRTKQSRAAEIQSEDD